MPPKETGKKVESSHSMALRGHESDKEHADPPENQEMFTFMAKLQAMMQANEAMMRDLKIDLERKMESQRTQTEDNLRQYLREIIHAQGGINVAIGDVEIPPPPLGVDNVLERQDLVLPIEEVADNVNEVNRAEVAAYVPPRVRGNGAGNGHHGNHNGHNGVRNGGNGNANGNNHHPHAAPRQQQQQPRGALAPAHRAPIMEAFHQEEPAQAPLNANQVMEMIQDVIGPGFRRMNRQIFQKPYPEAFDQLHPFPRGYKIPDFNPTFSGTSSDLSTVEHVGRFSIQCGEANTGFQKLRLFPNSLTGVAFTWYINLPPNSVTTWEEMERLFHTQFYKLEPEISMVDLSRLSQRKGESAKDYIARFKKLRNRCRIALPEQEFVRLAQNGLDLELRKKFEGMEFRDYYEMSTKVARYERLLHEELERRSSSYGTYYHEPNYELGVAEIKTDRPIECPALVKTGMRHPQTQEYLATAYQRQAEKKPHDGNRIYSFDVSKTSDVFDYLYKSGMVKFPPGHNIPSPEIIKGKEYCKYHDSWRHSTNSCTVFRNIVQEKIEHGILKFPEPSKKDMGVDKDPFPAAVNMVSINFPKDGRLTKEEKAKDVLEEGQVASMKKKSVVHFDQEPCDKPKKQRYGYANSRKIDFVPNQIGRPIPRPVALNMTPRRKVELTPPTARHVVSRAENYLPNKNVPRRLNFDHDQGRSMHRHTDEKPKDQVAYASAKEVCFANPKPKQIMPHPMVPSTSKAIQSSSFMLNENVKFPTKPRSVRPRSELRPWLEGRKEEYRVRSINQEVQRRESYSIRKFQPRMVRPANGVPYGIWQKVEHPKFPNPPLQRNRKTWRRRELRRRARARKGMEMNEGFDNWNSKPQKCNDNIDGVEEGSSNDAHPMLKVTHDMSFEQLVMAGLEPLRAKVVLEQARLDEQEAKIKRKEAELDIRTNVLADMIIALNKARDEFNRQKMGDVDQDKVDNKKDDVNVVDLVNALCENTSFDEEMDLSEPLPNGDVEDEILLPCKSEKCSGGKDNEAKAITFLKPNENATRHIKPLYIKAHFDGIPLNRILSGAVSKTRGILPTSLTVGSKTSVSALFVVDSSSTYHALLGRDWIHSNWCVPSSLHQFLMFWNGNEVEIVHADNKPFKVESNAVEARYYDESVGTIRFLGQDKYGRPMPMVSSMQTRKIGVKEAMEDLVRPNAIIPYRPLGCAPIIEEIS
ncbi:Retrotransposon gag protein [Corchorus capsularis]|uniref:Retrotransposon gag protein n=1 Tax=Corchorus capsularis TaxID=210143 RepID=A0A1R3FZT9_COCAP|nr:Retrotransposon gag protein [Corchorus capsularis]